jgi:DNA topoisomerase I
MIKRRGRFGEFLGCSGYSIKTEAGDPTCSTIINLDKQGNPMPPKAPPIKTTIACEKCGGTMVLRGGKRGPWLGCDKFPKCRNILSMKKLAPDQVKQVEALVPLLNEGAAKAQELVAKIIGANPTAASTTVPATIATDIDCDECGKPMMIRTGRKGRFLGCSGYPKCKNTGEVTAKLLEEMGLNGDGRNNGQSEEKPSKKSKGKADAEEEDLDAGLNID